MSQLDDLREEYFSHIDHCWKSSEDFDTVPLVSKEEFDEVINQVRAEVWEEAQDAVTVYQDIYGASMVYEDNPYKESK